jgi:molecular chaperone HtpG
VSGNKSFKIESKELMNLLINSVYSNKDIFLRELIANASDACDKKYFEQYEKGITGSSKNEFEIHIQINKQNRILTVSDNGIGMNEKELEDYLGRIAFSGTKVLNDVIRKKLNIDMIGQFGIGFYSAFLISDKVEVMTRRYDEEQTIRFVSEGMDGYTIEKTSDHVSGTTIKCYLKADDERNNYSKYLDSVKIKGIVKRYSNFIRYSVVLNEKGIKEVINDKTPIWMKSGTEVDIASDNLFYTNFFNDKNEPLKVIRMNVDGIPSFKALLYIPLKSEKFQHNLEQNEGIQIYIKNNFVKNDCNKLFPPYLAFLEGVIDSLDIALSISRELPQDDVNLSKIIKLITKKVISELKNWMSQDLDTYVEFWKEYGSELLFSQFYENNRYSERDLDQLFLFKSSYQDTYTTLEDYLNRNPRSNYIYYVTAKSIDHAKTLPQFDVVTNDKIEVLYCISIAEEYYAASSNYRGNIEFKSILESSSKVENIEEKREISSKSKENEALLDELRNILIDDVDTVEFSLKSKNHAVYLEETGEIGARLEKAFGSDSKAKSTQKLVLNPNHKLIEKLDMIYTHHPSKLKEYAYVLYNSARLINGMEVENPTKLSELIVKLMIDSDD